MDSFVLDQSSTLCTFVLTLITLVKLLTRMHSQMPFKINELSESFITLGAHILSFTSMGFLVSDQVTASCTFKFTLVTLVWLLTRVDSFMCGQTTT